MEYFSIYPANDFTAFSISHLFVLLLLCVGILFLYLFRGSFQHAASKDKIRIGMAILLLLSEVVLQAWRTKNGIWSLQSSLPLHLCSMAIILCPIMLITKKYSLYEILFFWGIGGTTQAILTPDLWYGFPHFIFFQYFAAHSLIVVACLWMTLVEKFRPTFKSIGKTFIATNLYAGFVFVINLAVGSNYLYIMQKPGKATIFDYLMPWPWYLLQMEIILLIICLLCYLPFIIIDNRREKFTN